MPILPQGDTFAPGPVISGSKPHGHRWRYCAYSVQSTNYNQDSRVPFVEKTYHQETDGKMYSYGAGYLMGWVCPDNGCSFYLGTATTEVTQHGRVFTVSGTCPRTEQDFATLSGHVSHLTQGRVIVAGTRYLEI
jgi:hypothetical protein